MQAKWRAIGKRRLVIFFLNSIPYLPFGDSPAPAAFRSTHRAAEELLDQVRERIRDQRYSIRTDQAYLCWVRTEIAASDQCDYFSPNTSCMSNRPRSRPLMKRPARRAPSA